MRSGVVLVVDDDSANRELLCHLLAAKGFSTRSAAGGRQALEILAGERVDLVLLDLEMPDLGGMEVLTTIRRAPRDRHVPVIMITAAGGSDEVVRALDGGANDYVTKPVDFPVLVARIQAQLRRPGAAAASSGFAEASPSTVPELEVKPTVVLGERVATSPAPEGELAPGTVIADSYRIEDVLGRGGWGTVYRARHLRLPRDVAVKVLHQGRSHEERRITRFRREGAAACRIKHPNAVSVLDFGVSPDGLAYLVMELLEGCTLAELLSRVSRLPLTRAAELLLPVCDVLVEIHAAGVLHRDLKPSNIFLENQGGRETVKVVDFGIAKLIDDSDTHDPLTLDGAILGTPAYMAPERLSGYGDDPSSDIYSLGVILFEMLAGRRPFSGDSFTIAIRQCNEEPPRMSTLVPEIPVLVEALVAHALAKDPARRPTARQFGERLADAVR